MQQSSTTPQKPRCVGIGLRKIVACSHSSSQCLLVPTALGMVSSVHPTSNFYTCFTNFLSRFSLDCSMRRDGVTTYQCATHLSYSVAFVSSILAGPKNDRGRLTLPYLPHSC